MKLLTPAIYQANLGRGFTEEDHAGPRRDSLPEHRTYVDTGCDLHSACLTCPFERCRYDDDSGERRFGTEVRQAEIVALRTAGLTVNEIAAKVGVARRTVFRHLAEERLRGE